MMKNENLKENLKKCHFAVTLIGGEGCANCVTMLPAVMKLKEREGIDVFHVEVDESISELLQFYEVSLVPTILITHYGELVSKITGYQPEEIFELYIEAKWEEINS